MVVLSAAKVIQKSNPHKFILVISYNPHKFYYVLLSKSHKFAMVTRGQVLSHPFTG